MDKTSIIFTVIPNGSAKDIIKASHIWSLSIVLQKKDIIVLAFKLFKNRTPKLINSKMYTKSSIGTNNNAKPKEVFEGINKDNIWNLGFWIQIIFIPTKIERDKVNVTIRWLIVVKL